ncbi:MFS transporter [Kibdelosporangium philippinense]|uniref:MFS transporter n=1 Tax=Kibdelosporangium philippinense TaxID=211113 RepID=A0ABS8ZSZ7_9PSEU|nr:MFS transporter [Kibdelosporangium philippinense]MCE7010835.1 MFS transporter [Kibdelosporangium philippinense]
MTIYRWTVLVTVLWCFLPAAVDVTILNIAVPALTAEMRLTAGEILWIVDVYSLTMIGLVLVTGPLGDRIGHKRLLVIGLWVFGVASGLSAFARTPAELIAGRVAVAIGAAMIIPATLAIIRQTFHAGRSHSVAIGAWSAVAAGASALGPVAGGLLLNHFWWGSIFLVNVPIVAIALPVVGFLLKNEVSETKQPWEATSPALAIVGSLGIAYAIIALPHGHAVEIVGSGLIGVIAAVIFVRRQQRLPHPMLDVSLFRRPRFRTGAVASTLPVLVMVGFELQLVQYLQLTLDKSPRDAAFALLPMPLAALIAAPLTGLVVSRIGSRAGIFAGLVVAAIGYVVVADGPLLGVGLALVGAGHGAVQMIASDLIMTGAGAEQAGAAAGVESVSFEAGAGLGVALIGTFVAFTGSFQAVAIVCAVLIGATITVALPRRD